MDVRRRLVGLALCSAMLTAGIAAVPGSSPLRADGALTIDGQYESAGPIGPGEVRDLVVVGRGGVPATGVGAVALNVTVTNPTQASYITAWPTGQPRPTAANLNFVAGQTVPNMVVVKVGDYGQVSFFNYAGSTDLVVDVAGWFPVGSAYTGLTPARLMDSRTGYPTIDSQFSGTGQVGPAATADLQVVNRGGVPASGVGAVALNVTVVNPSASSFLTVWPKGAPRPTSANLNYVPGDVVPNMVIVKVGDDGNVSMFNYAGSTDIVVDVLGWFPATGSFEGLTPGRLMDTRAGYPTIDGQFSGEGSIGAAATRDLVVVGRGGVPASGVGAVVLNVTATNPTAPSFLTVFPKGSARPNAANLNFVAGQTVPNMVIAKVGDDGKISIFNYGGNVDVVVDVMGWFPEGVAYNGLVPARLMDTRPGGTPTTPTLPTTTAPGGSTTTAPGATTTTAPHPTTTAPPPPAPWTERAVNMPVTPRNNTPYIARGGNQEIYDLEVIGNNVYVLGSFTDVRQTQGGAATGLTRLIKYNMNTGALDLTFDPVFDDELTAMVRSPDNLSLYVVGRFNTVDGLQRRKVVKLNATTGAVDTNFNAGPAFGARATAVVASATKVYVGGQFETAGGTNHSGLVALDATTGAIDTSFNVQITGGIGAGGLLTVQEMLLTQDGSTLIVVHTGRQFDGQDRYGVGMIDTATNTVLPWRTNLFQDNLASVGGTIRVYAADLAPNQQYFVVTSGSGGDRPPISDVAIAFPMASSSNVQPVWVSRHFDSVYAVAITDNYVFVGGHFSWEESPRSAQPWPGLATVGYGTGQGLGGYALGDQVTRREQLGALDPTTGVALEWSPWANGNEGVKALKASSRGLFVGVDATTMGTLNTGETAFFDVNTLPVPNGVSATIVSPYDGIVVQSGQPVTIEGTAVAGAGINSVQIDLHTRGSASHLCTNGTFATNCAYPTATLGSPGSTASNWSIPITLNSTEYILRARTVQTGGIQSAWTQSTIEGFQFNDAQPSTAITLPAGGLITTNTFVVTGTAQDDHAVNAMNYVIYNPTTQEYIQDDGTAGTGYNSFNGVPDVPGLANATWTFEMTVPNGDWELTASAIDNAGQADLRGATREWLVDPTGQSPLVSITSPVTWNPVAQPAPPAPPVTPPAATLTAVPGQQNLTFTGTASDDASISEIDVSLRNLTTRENLAADGTWSSNVSSGFYRIAQPNAATANWSFNLSSVIANLTPGVYTFRVRAIDNVQLSTTSYNTATVTLTVQYAGDAFPTTTINPGPSGVTPDQSLEVLHLDLSGTASDNAGVTAVRVVINDLDTATYLTASGGPMSSAYTVLTPTLGTPGGTSTTWSLSVDLPAQGEYNVTAQAVDTAGQWATFGTTTTGTWRYLIYPGDLDPTITAALNQPMSPASAAALNGISVSGRAEDDPNTGGMTAVRITIRQGAGNYFSTTTNTFSSASAANINAFLTSPGSPGSNFSYATPLAANSAFTAGTYTITETPVDEWGQVGAPYVLTLTLT